MIEVPFPASPYRIHIEPGLLQRAGELIRSIVPAHRACIIADEQLTRSHLPSLQNSLHASKYQTAVLTVRAAEQDKSLDQAKLLYAELLRSKFDRISPVIAFGGGIVGDLAGFVAATFLRGVPLIQIPTTLLAMVDASIGGKTGVNIPLPDSGGLGKNLVGAFWQPRIVIIDPEVLTTLSNRDFGCGLAECIKHAMIADAGLLAWIESNADAILRHEQAKVTELISRCAKIKVQIVVEDERESGRRALLNLGHTFAHAIESVEQLALRHGEAVAVGLLAACTLAHSMNRMNDSDLARIERLLSSLGLPTRLPTQVSGETLMLAMMYDKKSFAGTHRLIIPLGLGAADVSDSVPAAVILDAWKAVGAD